MLLAFGWVAATSGPLAPIKVTLRKKMLAAKTPEDRQALAAATRAGMEKRAKARGIELPGKSALGGGMGAHRSHASDHQH